MNAALLLALALSAAAQQSAVEREELAVLGWNDACSVAVRHEVFHQLGAAIYNEPVSIKIGALSIPAGGQKAGAEWFYEASGSGVWNPRAVARVEKSLRKQGYARTGYAETVRPNPATSQPGLAETILSTRTLALRPGLAWPDADWRWSGANYSPLGTCALLLFDSLSGPPRRAWLLARIYNPRARLERSRAHAANARLLFGEGELEDAVAEAGTAARLAPESALARYTYAALLSLAGRANEAMVELKAATVREPEYLDRVKDDEDFESLRSRRDFRDLVGPTYRDRVSR